MSILNDEKEREIALELMLSQIQDLAEHEVIIFKSAFRLGWLSYAAHRKTIEKIIGVG